jgi:hypothetical protein
VGVSFCKGMPAAPRWQQSDTAARGNHRLRAVARGPSPRPAMGDLLKAPLHSPVQSRKPWLLGSRRDIAIVHLGSIAAAGAKSFLAVAVAKSTAQSPTDGHCLGCREEGDCAVAMMEIQGYPRQNSARETHGIDRRPRWLERAVGHLGRYHSSSSSLPKPDI